MKTFDIQDIRFAMQIAEATTRWWMDSDSKAAMNRYKKLVREAFRGQGIPLSPAQLDMFVHHAGHSRLVTAEEVFQGFENPDPNPRDA